MPTVRSSAGASVPLGGSIRTESPFCWASASSVRQRKSVAIRVRLRSLMTRRAATCTYVSPSGTADVDRHARRATTSAYTGR